MGDLAPIGHAQLRRKGRNAYRADDVHALILLFKRDLAAAHQQAYEARLDLQREIAAAAQPGGPEGPGLTEHRRLLREVTMLEQVRNSLIEDITNRRVQIADLDELLARRRADVKALAHELLAAFGPVSATIDLDSLEAVPAAAPQPGARLPATADLFD